MNKPLYRRHAWLTSDGGRCNLRGVLNITLPKWPQPVSYHMAIDNSTLFSWEGGSKEGWGKEGWYKRMVGGREGGRSGRREGGREGRREGGMDGGTEGGREGGREGGGVEGGREGEREGGRQEVGRRKEGARGWWGRQRGRERAEEGR